MHSAVVTGGAGFIGSHLCEALLGTGNRVVCVDSFVTGRKENILHLMRNKNFSLLEHDITKPFDVEGKVGFVYNLASPASPKDFSRIPVEIMMANSAGVKNALDLALGKGARFLQASTSEVYGDPLEHPQKETYYGNVNPVGARSCYDESKRFAEALVMIYRQKLGLNAGIARIFNTYGSRMRIDDGRVVPTFIIQALASKPLTVYGKGEQTRSFCFVADLVGGLIKMMNSNLAGPVNIGNPHEISIARFAGLVLTLTGSKSKLAFKRLPEEDPARRQPDISLAKAKLGWEPKTSLEDGLRQTISWFKETL